MDKKYPRVLWWLTVLTFLVPLIVIPGSFIFPFIVPKALAFRTLVLCMLGVFVSGYYTKGSTVRMNLGWISGAVILFGISFALSTFFGTDIHHSLWDNHERMLGLFTVLHYILYFFILSNTFQGKETWNRLIELFVGAGSVVMVLGVLQKISPQFLMNNGSERVSATLGNAIYLGAYGLFLFFCGLYLYTQGRKWVLGASLLGVMGIIVSGTRGSVLGMGAGLSAMLVVYFFTLPKEHEKARRWLGYLALGLIGLASLLFVFRQTPVVRSIPAVGSLLNTTLSGTASTRIMAWKIAIVGWQERPVLGWGPNNFFYAFNKYYNPDFLKFGWGETWFDNAHNIILNTLATQGLVGVVSYLSLFGTGVWVLIRGQKKGKISYHLAAIGTGFLAAHLVQNIFVFENITSYLYFFFFLAFIESITRERSNEESVTARPALSAAMQWGWWGGVVILIFTTNLNPARANMSMIDTLQTIYRGGDILTSFDQTASIPSPHHNDNRLDFARIITQAAQVYVQNGKQAQYQPLLQRAVDELDKNRTEHPNDIRNHVQEAQLLQLSFEVFRNADHLLKARDILEEAQMKSPDRQQIDYMLSGIELMVGEKKQAVERMKASVARSPEIQEGWWRLIYTVQQTGDIEGAKVLAREARAKGIVFDPTGESIVGLLVPKTTSTQP